MNSGLLEELLMLDSNLIDYFLIDMIDEGSDSDESLPQEDNNYVLSSDSSDSDNESVAEEETDDEVIQNIISRQNATSANPQPFRVSTQASDISFQPNDNLLAVGDLSGQLTFYNVDDSSVNVMSVHNDSVRGVDYFPDGSRVASVSSDGTFYFINVERKRKTEVNTDEDIDSEFYVVKTLTDEICVTGHEGGSIMLWDARVRHFISSFDCSDSAVSSIHYSSNVNRLFLTTDNGELAVYDMRSFKNVKELKKSEPYTSELTCCTTIRSDRNIVCGTGQGHILLFDYEIFELEPYKPNNTKKEILSIVGATENIVITGNECGKINAYHLYPNQPIGLIGSHDNWDVNKLEINYSGNILASLAEDEVKFWEISFLEDVGKVIEKNKDRDKSSFALPSSQIMSRHEFFSDLNEQDDDEDDDT